MLIKKGNAPLSSAITARSNTQYMRKEYGSIIAQKTIKTKRCGYRVTIQKTAFNQFIIMLLFIVGILLTYMLLAYIFGVPGDAALRIGG